MQGSQLDVLTGCLSCLEQGESVTLVSVAKTWGTSPRPLGSLLAISSSGRFFGSVSGGCVEEDLIDRLTHQPVSSIEPISYGETAEERSRFGLPCGGELALIAEPIRSIEEVHSLIEKIQHRKTLVRQVNRSSGHARYLPWTDQSPKLTNEYWQNVFGPMWRLIIIGAGETGQFLAEFAQGLGFEVLVSDPRPDYRNNWPVSHISLEEGFPDDVIEALKVDERTAIVAVAHDPKVDDMALLTALHSNAFYVGALGSQQNNQARRERLKEHFAFTDDDIGRLHGPVGLNIGSKSPAEIALSIMAEVVAIKNGIQPANAMEKKADQTSKTKSCELNA